MSDQTQGTATPEPTLDPKAIVAQVADKIAPEAPKEPTQEPPKEEAKPDEALSSKFGALARKERKLTQAERELKAREAAIAEREAKYKQWEEEQAKPKEEPKKKSPWRVLKESGLSLAELNEWYLSGQKVPEDEIFQEVEARVESRLEKIERENREKEERTRKEREDEAKKQEAEAIERFRANIKDHITKSAEKYELTSLYDPEGEAVFNTINEYFEAHQKVLSTDEACELVEKYLEAEAEKALKAKKFQSKLKPVEESPKDPAPNDDKGASLTQKTLANTLTATGAPINQPARSEEERRRRALEILERGA